MDSWVPKAALSRNSDKEFDSSSSGSEFEFEFVKAITDHVKRVVLKNIQLATLPTLRSLFRTSASALLTCHFGAKVCPPTTINSSYSIMKVTYLATTLHSSRILSFAFCSYDLAKSSKISCKACC